MPTLRHTETAVTAPQGGDARSTTLLLVDDSPVNLDLVVESLEGQGYEVLVAVDGAEALERAERVIPDLILLDAMMPGTDGFEVCRRLKTNPATRDIPVIFMTALSGTRHKVDGFAAGAVDYLTKPLHVDEVRARVDAHLRLRALHRQLEEKNAALARSEKEFRTLAEHLPDLLIRYDRDGRRIYVNQAMEALFPHAETLLGSTPTDQRLVDDAEAARILERIRVTTADRHPTESEVVAHAPNGERRIFHSRYVPEFGTDGEIESVLSISRDITAMKRNEEALRLAASVFHNAREGIIVTDAENRIIDVNDAFTRVTGYPRDEVLGRSPALLKSGRQDAAFYRAMWHALSASGHWSGEVWNRRRDGGDYAERLTISVVRDEAGELSHYIAVFSDITELKSYQQELERLARHDPLTGLPNRALLADRLEQAIAHTRRHQRRLAVCYLDLDGFKAVNDRLGHEAGDRLLVAIARRLKECLRGDDSVARVGGDEFVLLLVDIEHPAECDAILQRVVEAVARPVPLGEGSGRVSTSLGFALFPDDATDPRTLLHYADQAMYQTKHQGKNHHRRFSSVGTDHASERPR